MRSRISSLVKMIFSIWMLNALNIFAAGESDFPANYYDIVAAFLLMIIIISFFTLVYFEGKKQTVKEKKFVLLWNKFKQYITKTTPLEKEDEIILADHNYDGIRELDNKIPPWFSGLFYVTIIFSVWYMLYFHVFNAGPLQAEEYSQQVKQAELQRAELIKSGALINEESVTRLTAASELESGKEIFMANCVACHANDGGGIVGPNLTDKYWIHGGGIKNVFKVIKYGVPAKGMISWQNQLNPKQMQEVASYILTLEGTNPANPKAPEGTIWSGDSTAVN